MEQNADTQARILAVATEIFHQKGFDGARMQEIADAAQINKAMLHYYFRSKKQLFQQIFIQALGKLIPRIQATLAEDIPLEAKFERISQYYHGLLRENPHLPMFVLGALQSNPQEFADELTAELDPQGLIASFVPQVQKGVMAGEIKPIDPRHMLLNMISMSVFPFMMRPVLTRFFGMNEEQFDAFVTERESLVPEFLLNGISTKPES